MTDGKANNFRDGDYGAGASSLGLAQADRAELHDAKSASEQFTDTSHVANPLAAPAPATAEVPASDPVEPEAFVDPREAIAARFKTRRQGHDSQFTPEHVPPFIANAPQAIDTPLQSGAPLEPSPVHDAPAYVLKVRGQEVPVTSRAELLRLAEVEPHEEADFDDARLVRVAQKNQAALASLEEAKQIRNQARVAVPEPAGHPAAALQQQPAPVPVPQAPKLEELRSEYVRLQTYGEPQEAEAAFDRYLNARDDQREAARSTQTIQHQRMTEANQAVVSFSERNQDLIANPAASDLLLMTATREMESDLRAAGLSDNDLRGVLSNPELMTKAYNAARQYGLTVREPNQIIEAAGQKVRTAFGMPASAPQRQTPSPAPSRQDEKRALTAQPTRSGSPVQTPSAPVNQVASRKSAIQKMQQHRTGRNIDRVLGG